MRFKTFPSILLSLLFAVSLYSQDKPGMEKVLVQGNKFVTESGQTLIFQGVNIRDPYDLQKDGFWTKAHFEKAKEWGADMIRLPVHPASWRAKGEIEYLKLLDEAVEWARELSIYLIIDWHSIGNLQSGKFQNPMYNTDIEETQAFWDLVSGHFAGEAVIAMYELFNEPTVGGRFGDLTWTEWKGINEEMISMIRKNDPETVILVAGFNWAYDLTPVKTEPIVGNNIAYVSHPYPEKRPQPWESQWEDDWGFVAKKYPVILTEIGFALPEEKGVHIPVHGDETYGQALVDFCADRGISWVVWVFDDRWAPMMYSGDYVPTRQGALFKKVMTGK